MLGQPLYMVMPQVVGFRLTGELRDGVTATDLVLTVTQMLRKKGVVDKFVEFCGPGLSAMSLARPRDDREHGARVRRDHAASSRSTTRRCAISSARTARASADCRALLPRSRACSAPSERPIPSFSDTLALDLGDVEPSLAGPKRPQDRVPLREMKDSFRRALTAPVKERGYGLAEAELSRTATVGGNGASATLDHGAVVIAAITSCTNTSNPSVMVGAGLLAKKAVERGLKVKPYVKTSMAPGSKVVTEYLKAAGLTADLEALGFHIVGYGCTTCMPRDTPVLMADGTSRRIEDLPEQGGAKLWAPDGKGQLRAGRPDRADGSGHPRMRHAVPRGGPEADLHAGPRDPRRRWPLGARGCTGVAAGSGRRDGRGQS